MCGYYVMFAGLYPGLFIKIRTKELVQIGHCILGGQMVSRSWLSGIILAVPSIGFTVPEGLQAHLNSQLRTQDKARTQP